MGDLLKAVVSTGSKFVKRGAELSEEVVKGVVKGTQVSTQLLSTVPAVLTADAEAMRKANAQLAIITNSDPAGHLSLYRREGSSSELKIQDALLADVGIQGDVLSIYISLASLVSLVSAGLGIAAHVDRVRAKNEHIWRELYDAVTTPTTDPKDAYRFLSAEQRDKLLSILDSALVKDRRKLSNGEEIVIIEKAERAQALYEMGAKYILEDQPLGDRPEYVSRANWEEFKKIVEAAKQAVAQNRPPALAAGEPTQRQLTGGDSLAEKISQIELEIERFRVDFCESGRRIYQAMDHLEVQPEAILASLKKSQGLLEQIKKRYDALELIASPEQSRGQNAAIDGEMRKLLESLISRCDERIASDKLTENGKAPWRELKRQLEMQKSQDSKKPHDSDEDPPGGAAVDDAEIRIVQLDPKRLALPAGKESSFEALAVWNPAQDGAALVNAVEAQLAANPVTTIGEIFPGATLTVLGVKLSLAPATAPVVPRLRLAVP